MSNDKLFNTELNQAGWTEQTLSESEHDPLCESAIALAKALGLDTLNMIMAEENNDIERAENLKQLIEKYQAQLRRIVRIRLKQQEK